MLDTNATKSLVLANKLEGLEDLGQRDFVLPRWSLIQPTSRKEGADEHVGQFLRNIDGEFRAELLTVILKVSPTRLLWSGDPTETQPECVSRDAVTGSVYGTCTGCQFNPTANPDLMRELQEARKSGQASLLKVCNYGYTLVVVDDLDTGSLALLGAMGTSVRSVKTLNTQFLMRRRPVFSAVVSWTAVKQVSDRGKYYMLQPTIQRWLSAEETAHWRELYLSIQGATIGDIPDDAAEDGGEEDVRF